MSITTAGASRTTVPESAEATKPPAAFQPTSAKPDVAKPDEPVGQCFASHPDDSTTRTIKTNAGFHLGSVKAKGEVSRSIQQKHGEPDKNGNGAFTVTVTEKGTYKAAADLSKSTSTDAQQNRSIASTYKFDTEEDADRAATILAEPVITTEANNWVRSHPLASRTETAEVSTSESWKPGGDEKLGDALGAGTGSSATRTQTRTVEYDDDGKATAVKFSTETTQERTTDAGITKISGEGKVMSGSMSTGVGTSELQKTTREVTYDISNNPEAGERLSAGRDDASRLLDPMHPYVFFKGPEDPTAVLAETNRLGQPNTLTVTTETSTPTLDASGPKQVKTTRTETTENPSLQPAGTPEDRGRTTVDNSTRIVSSTRQEGEGTLDVRYGLEYGATATEESEKIEQETKSPRTDLDGNPVG